MCPRFPEFLGFKPLNYATLIQSTAISHLDILVVSSHPISPMLHPVYFELWSQVNLFK